VALENPESVVSLPDGTSFRADDDRLPDLAGNVRFENSIGKFSVAGLLREVRVDSAAAPASTSHKAGGGIGINGVIPYGARDDARFSLYYGNALGRYTAGFFGDGVLDKGGHVQLADQWIAAAAYRHYWGETLRSTLALSGLQSNNAPGTAGNVNRSAQSAHVNLIWSPVPQTNLGVEFIHARRVTEDGQSGTLNRLQTSAQYFF
jgi:hypothetical protein